MAQFRLGILPLEIEIGRYRDIPLSKRICKMCEKNAIEDEIHFLCECQSYKDFRSILYSRASENDENFYTKDVIDKFVFLMSNHQKYVVTFLTNAAFKRTQYIYSLSN